MSDYKAWEVTYETNQSGRNETLVVALDPDGAKQAVSSIGDDQTFITVEDVGSIPTAIAEQQFHGYMPRLRFVLSGVAAIARRVRGDD